ncbi:leucine-rich repeat-containing protein 15-like [Ptychodera flava]|uniref:leucine-rich repeat-containing protein 15-like n=1 Tax=Ptychodera flava TaxID=63121 RepID=UPI003969DE99
MMEYTSKLASIIYLLTIGMSRLEGCPAVCSCTGTTVDCSNRGLTEIPSGIPTSTTFLRLDRNQLTYIENDSFTGLSSLTDLYLYSNRLEEVAAGAFTGLSRLGILYLYSNSIGELPETVFHGLDELTYIHLYNNKLSCLPENLFLGLHNLATLRLDYNEITELSTSIFRGLGKPCNLNLPSNSLSSLEEDTFDEVSNQDLLTFHPRTVFHGLEKLLYLYLHHNKLSCLHENLFSGLSNPQILYLYNNDITDLPASIFRGLGQLRYLYLHSNSLNFLDENMFNGLNNLDRLRIYQNNLKTLPENIFHGLSRLNRLYVYSNDITTLPANVFEGLDNLRYLYMYSNPWSCDCRLRELRAWLDYNSDRLSFGSTAMRCESPDRHRSMSILDVPLNELTCYPIPVFYTAFKTITAETGGDVILDCEVESELEVDKYWILPNGTVIHQSTEDMCSDYGIVQQSDGSLVIPFAEVEDEGSYSCMVSNLQGTTSGVRVLKINLTSLHVTTETMSTTLEGMSTAPKIVYTTFGTTPFITTDYTNMYTTVSAQPDMSDNTNVTFGMLAYFLGIITAGLCAVAFLAIRRYRRAKPKRSDDNYDYANHNFGGDSSDTSADQLGYDIERSAAMVKSARRENQNDRYVLPPRRLDKNQQQQQHQVYANAAAIEDAESSYTSLSPETIQTSIYESVG